MTRTTISGAENNPFKWAPTQRLEIDLILGRALGFLPGSAGLQSSICDIKWPLVARLAAMRGSLSQAVAGFAPADLSQATDSRARVQNRPAAQITGVARRHAALWEGGECEASGALDRAFYRAYDAERATAPEKPLHDFISHFGAQPL